MGNKQSILPEMYDCFAPESQRNPKTIAELWQEFDNRYSVLEIARSNELQFLFQYLQREMKTENGNHVKVPSAFVQRLIRKHLNYSFPVEKCKL